MKKKFYVITLCGSTKFKSEFEFVQKELTLEGNIVLSVGLFGHSGDNEVWDNKSENTLSKTKMMLDMHRSKIDMSDGIYVINPDGYIGDGTWSEICYAKMTDKSIGYMEPISESDIDSHVSMHIHAAKFSAHRQVDLAKSYPGSCHTKNLVSFNYNDKTIINPWVSPEYQTTIDTIVRTSHKMENPFEFYGKENVARFIEEIVAKKKIDDEIDKYNYEHPRKIETNRMVLDKIFGKTSDASFVNISGMPSFVLGRAWLDAEYNAD